MFLMNVCEWVNVSSDHVTDLRQIMNHIVDMCSLTKFEVRLNLLHKAYDNAVMWLESTATAALAN